MGGGADYIYIYIFRLLLAFFLPVTSFINLLMNLLICKFIYRFIYLFCNNYLMKSFGSGFFRFG